ncbi:hypothetical protein MPH_08586 [Macrophomina phaseolina MS6]|uniref:Uncharacterized protein n=1 Tax=Macrophomina phaseolina (strain MS6) TaxID=1126212 RepID=K2QWL2_MACPH|nr:hypothetical protein MPH_08586 [Macrophomina phaseolina MS6]
MLSGKSSTALGSNRANSRAKVSTMPEFGSRCIFDAIFSWAAPSSSGITRFNSLHTPAWPLHAAKITASATISSTGSDLSSIPLASSSVASVTSYDQPGIAGFERVGSSNVSRKSRTAGGSTAAQRRHSGGSVAASSLSCSSPQRNSSLA